MTRAAARMARFTRLQIWVQKEKRRQGCVRSGDGGIPNLVHSDLEPTAAPIDIRSHKLLVALSEIHDPFDDADHVHKR